MKMLLTVVQRRGCASYLKTQTYVVKMIMRVEVNATSRQSR